MFIIQEGTLVKYESIAAVEIQGQFLKILFLGIGHDYVQLDLRQDLHFRYPGGVLSDEEHDFMDWLIEKQKEVKEG